MIPKAFLIDIDNTLTNSRKEISSNIKEIIMRFAERNIPIAVCTSRHYAAIKNDVLPLFPKETVHIVAGGGQVVMGSGTILWEKCIPSNTVDEILKKIMANNGWCGFGIGNTMYLSDNMRDAYVKRNIWKIDAQSISSISNYATPIMFTSVPNEDIQRYLQEHPLLEVKILSSKTYGVGKYADITMKGITKAFGMAQWCKYMEIQPKDIVAVGDSMNDVEMLKFSGFPVAMGNADDEVKLLSKRVIGHTDEDGLATFLQSYLDNKALSS